MSTELKSITVAIPSESQFNAGNGTYLTSYELDFDISSSFLFLSDDKIYVADFDNKIEFQQVEFERNAMTIAKLVGVSQTVPLTMITNKGNIPINLFLCDSKKISFNGKLLVKQVPDTVVFWQITETGAQIDVDFKPQELEAIHLKHPKSPTVSNALQKFCGARNPIIGYLIAESTVCIGEELFRLDNQNLVVKIPFGFPYIPGNEWFVHIVDDCSITQRIVANPLEVMQFDPSLKKIDLIDTSDPSIRNNISIEDFKKYCTRYSLSVTSSFALSRLQTINDTFVSSPSGKFNINFDLNATTSNHMSHLEAVRKASADRAAKIEADKLQKLQEEREKARLVAEEAERSKALELIPKLQAEISDLKKNLEFKEEKIALLEEAIRILNERKTVVKPGFKGLLERIDDAINDLGKNQ